MFVFRTGLIETIMVATSACSGLWDFVLMCGLGKRCYTEEALLQDRLLSARKKRDKAQESTAAFEDS